ncbi:hypothetical protein H8356DRAFT_1322191 [Neocallimastix lanati (nom. inval.)]|nr:hypothetical protein H8356DRAFT_1322191 [Neocallimastix sp. JGI-2020a]
MSQVNNNFLIILDTFLRKGIFLFKIINRDISLITVGLKILVFSSLLIYTLLRKLLQTLMVKLSKRILIKSIVMFVNDVHHHLFLFNIFINGIFDKYKRYGFVFVVVYLLNNISYLMNTTEFLTNVIVVKSLNVKTIKQRKNSDTASNNDFYPFEVIIDEWEEIEAIFVVESYNVIFQYYYYSLHIAKNTIKAYDLMIVFLILKSKEIFKYHKAHHELTQFPLIYQTVMIMVELFEVTDILTYMVRKHGYSRRICRTNLDTLNELEALVPKKPFNGLNLDILQALKNQDQLIIKIGLVRHLCVPYYNDVFVKVPNNESIIIPTIININQHNNSNIIDNEILQPDRNSLGLKASRERAEQ